LYVIGVKITNVEVLVLKSPGLYQRPETPKSPLADIHGPAACSTDAGITGYSDMETSATVAKAAVERLHGVNGTECLKDWHRYNWRKSARARRLWYKMYRGSITTAARRGDPGDLGDDIALWILREVLRATRLRPIGARCGIECVLMRALVPAHARCDARATRVYLDKGFTAIKFGWAFREDPARRQACGSRAHGHGKQNDLLIDTGWFVERTPKERFR